MREHIHQPQNRSRLGIYLILALVGALFFECTPTIITQGQRIDTRLSDFEATGKTYEADAVGTGFQAGQWLQYKSVDEFDTPTIVTYKLISSDGFSHSVELVEEGYDGTTSRYMELQFDPGRAPSSLQVRRVLTKRNDDPPRESSPEDLLIKESYYRALASQLFVSWSDGTADENVSLAIGKFHGCYKRENILLIAGSTFRAQSWHHPAIPLFGMIKAERSDGTQGTMELVDFGFKGARSDVLRTVQ